MPVCPDINRFLNPLILNVHRTPQGLACVVLNSEGGEEAVKDNQVPTSGRTSFCFFFFLLLLTAVKEQRQPDSQTCLIFMIWDRGGPGSIGADENSRQSQ